MKLTVYLITFLIINLSAYGQIVINEVCSANGYLIQDFEGDFEDWIEVYNPSSTAISLNGFYLETFDTQQKRWDFPDVLLKPDSCMLIFCSGKDRSLIIDHYEVPIFPGTFWRYQLGSSEPDPTWTDPGFDDSGWASGQISIGYGDGDDATVISATTSLYMRDTFSLATTEQFLSGFMAMDYDDAFVAYINGVEIARNNIWNVGRPAYNAYASEEHEAAFYSCPSPDPFDCAEFFFIDEEILQSALVVGENVFSMQIHNFDQGLDDMSAYALPILGVAGSDTTFFSFPETSNLHTNFTLSREGQRLSLKNSAGEVEDEFIVGNVHVNHSRGRVPDGSDNWCLLINPTPCLANATTCYQGYAANCQISKESGFYDGPQSITITTDPPGELVYYTLDGSYPTALSPTYSGPITFNSSGTIRATVLSSDPNLLPSETVTKTYIIDDSSTMPVIFITTDSLWLFDDTTGIYMLGPNVDTATQSFPYWGVANYYQDVELPGHVEYLDANQVKQMGQDCSIKIHGNFSRGWPQKSFRFLANEKYGDGWFNFSPFPDKPNITRLKSFNVRNGGVDFNTTHFRDGLMNRAARDLNLEIMDHTGVLVYINGEYWGVYGLRERQDEKYIESNYEVNGDNIELLRFSGDEFQGSNDHYLSMVEYIVDNDMSVDSNYSWASQNLDIENFVDYMLTETYYGNYDWISSGGQTNNIKFWRNTLPVSKWRYILWDTDLGLNLVSGFGGGTGVEYNYLGAILEPDFTDPHSRMLLNLIDNPEFKNYFINRFADIVNTNFSPESFGEIAQEVYDEFEPEMERHFDLWGQPDKLVFNSFYLSRAENVAEWNTEFDSIVYFINNRPFHMRNNVEYTFGMTDQVDITLDVEPKGAGKIQISTVIPDDYPWTGVYYNGNPVTIKVFANPGYSFSHWEGTNLIGINDSLSIRNNYTLDESLTAHFDIIENDIISYPNPFTDEITFEVHMAEKGQASIKLYDLSGRLAAEVITYNNYLNAGIHKITFDAGQYNLQSGTYIMEFKTGDTEKTSKIVKINND